MPTEPPPPGFEEIQRQELSRLFGRMVGARLLFLPLVIALGTWAAFVDPARWRRAFVAAVVGALLAFSVAEAVRHRRRGVDRSIVVNVGVAVLGQAVLSLGTGGLESPLLPAMIVLAMVAGVFVSPPALIWVAAFQSSAVAAFAALERAGLGSPLHLAAFGAPAGGAARVWTVAAVFVFAVVGGAGLGRAIRWLFDGMLRKALQAREESLRAHRERAEELGALSAEIAHELKNPLASVKGLGGLLAQDVAAGKAAERLAVLRREVDRMQGILDEFLNFSRPLVPLALARVDLAALCRDVAALHEGLAQERGLGLEVRGGGAARCDPRKAKQVLINLVQNAVDASPPGAVVEIEAGEAPGGGARVRVLDRGPGLDPALGDKVFEPGVTTKARGSGIGLTVARALARQHGGDLRLSARPGGGLAAELVLPGPAAGAAPGEAA